MLCRIAAVTLTVTDLETVPFVAVMVAVPADFAITRPTMPRPVFATLATACDAVVIDHFVGGDGSADGARTRRTRLPLAMESARPGATTLAYRDEIVAIARRHVARVGVGADGFAGRFA